MTDAIEFARRTETAGFFSPLAGMELAEQTESRCAATRSPA